MTWLFIYILWDELIQIFFFHSVCFCVVAFIRLYPVLWESITDLLPLQSDQWRPWGLECWRYTLRVFSFNFISISTYDNDEMQGKIWSSCWYIICSLSTLYICSLVWSSYTKWCCLHCLNLGHSMLSVSLLQTSVSTLLESSIDHSCIWIVLFTISSLHQNMIVPALFLRVKMFFI